MRVLWQCEADPWRRAVLRRHWPDTPCYEDVTAHSGGISYTEAVIRSERCNGSERERDELGWCR